MRPLANPILRFEEKVERIPFSGCWLWTGSCSHNGYGFFRFDGKNTQAHRVSYKLFRGEIPDGLFVCHHCDVPCCVNPDHLFVGSRRDNLNDAKKKGRNKLLGRPGERHYLTTFKDEDVIEIRKLSKNGEACAHIARMYGKSETAIRWIIQRKSWQHL